MKNAYVTLLFLFSIFSLQGNEQYYFSTLSVKDGLSQISVLCTLQDQEGYLWLGTRKGLNRFNGYEFEVFLHDSSDSTSLSNDHIFCVEEDKEGKIWLGTQNGLNCFDPSTRAARSYFYDDSRQGKRPQNFILSLCCDEENSLWVGSECGLDVFDRISGRLTAVNPDGIFTDNPVHAVITGKEKHVLYVGTRYGGVFRLHTKNLTYERYRYRPDDPYSLSSNDIRTLYLDRNDRLWIGTNGEGVCLLEKESGTVKRGVAGLGKEIVRCFIESPDGAILIGTYNGLKVIRQSGEVKHYHVSDSGKGNLSHFSIYSLLFDQTGTLWVGTYGGGINYHNPYANKFKSHSPMVDKKGTRSVYSQIVEHNSVLYIATEGEGLLEYNIRNNTSKFYRLNKESGFTYDRNIIKSLSRKDDIIFCGTAFGSVYQFDTKTKQFSPLYIEKNKMYLNNVVYAMHQDKKGNFFIGTVGNSGFIRIHPDGRVQNVFPVAGKDSMQFRSILCMLEVEEGVYLLGSRNEGLFRYDIGSGQLIRYRKTEGKPETDLLKYQINQIYQDSYGRIWLATSGGGICHFDPKNESFTSYTTKDGLLDNTIGIILETPDKHFWISSSSGISDFDPKNKTCKNYSFADGIEVNEFSPQSGLLSSTGEIYFCGDNAFVSFNPFALKVNPSVPRIVINNLYVNNVKVLPGGSEGIWRENKKKEKQLVLRHDQTNIALEYAALSYIAADKNQYAYRLENFDEDWNQVGNRRIAYYTNIPSGSYVFRVIGSNNDGVWNEEGTSILIKVLPPPWKSWWAYLLYTGAGLLILGVIYHYFRERQRLENDIRLKQLEAKAQEEFHEERNKLFTNFSHELRSPLTLILSPLEEMAEAGEFSAKWKERILLMRNNARRLLRLVNNLMDFTKKESGTMQLKVAERDIVSFAHEMHLLFTELALARNIAFRFTPSEQTIRIWYDGGLIEKVFFNFLSNAFKNTPNGGSVDLKLFTKTRSELRDGLPEQLSLPGRSVDAYLLIQVADSGKGIPKSELVKIFDPFYQVSQNENASSGTGLGLSLSKSIIEMHHGLVWAESSEAKGAVFTCALPMGREVFAEQEIVVEDHGGDDISYYPVEVPRNALPDHQSKTKKYTVLVVEDNSDVRQYIVSHLSENYQIIACSNGEEGLEKAIHYLPDLILSDLMMPKMDGLEMCHKLKSDIRTSHIPVVMITARVTVNDIQTGYESGVDDYVTKPFHPDILLTRIRNLLQSREALKELYGKRFSLKSFGIETSSVDDQFMQKLYTVLHDNLSNPDLDLDGFCREIGMSRSNLYRKIKAITGFSPNEFVRNFRLEMAAKLLKESKMPVSDVYVAVGFNSHAYFTNCFKALYGVPPSEYLQQE